MDKASDFGSEDCEFESRPGRYFFACYSFFKTLRSYFVQDFHQHITLIVGRE